MNFDPYFREHKFSIADISDTSCRIVTKFCTVRGLANGNLFPEFDELLLWGPVLPCSDVHQSVTDAFVSYMFCICIVADIWTMHCWIVCLLLSHFSMLHHCAVLLQQEQLPAEEPHCPDKCSCSRYLKVVSCKYQRLRSIPNNIPNTVTKLYLSYNLLTDIGKGAFQNLTNLTALSLECNYIEKMADGAFLGLTKLETLYVRDNQLTMLSPEVFLDLHSLSDLYLSQNKLVNIPDMRYAPNIIYLTLDNNNLESASFPVGFNNLTRLSTVVLSNNPKLTQITDTDFAALNHSTVRKIAVSRCSLMDIGKEVFNFPHLQSVVLSYNLGWNETILRRVLSLFVNCSELTSLDLSGVFSLTRLPADIFNSLASVPLNHLNLAHTTHIAVVDNGTFQYFPMLEKLDLSKSEFHIIQDTMSHMKNLQSLNLAHNEQLEFVPSFNLPSLQVFDISSCTSLQDLKQQTFLGLPVLSTLIMHNCGIHTIHKDAFLGLDQLKKLDLSHNLIGSSSLPVDLFDPLIQLTELDLSNNKLKQILKEKDLFRNLKTLTTLDLSGNECSMIPEEIFNPLTSLTSLNLRQNCLGVGVISNVSRLLHPLRALKLLMLMENNIYDLPVGFFDNLFSLKMVNLSKNQLGGWNGYAFNDSTNLSVIDFSSNKITAVPELSVMPLAPSVKLNLSGNPFTCWCDLIWFRNWISSDNITDSKLPGLESYKCRSPLSMADKPVLDFDPKSIAKKCSPPPWIIIIVSASCSIAVVIVFSVAVCYKYRWPIRLKIYKMKKWTGCKQVYLRMDENAECDYSVYVSYGPSIADENWVMNTLMPVIDVKERARHAQMVLQQNDGSSIEENVAAPSIREFHSVNAYWEMRDMLPGTSEIGSVAEAIYGSHKIMLVVSLEYLRDGRRVFEIKMATEKSCHAHLHLEDIIIVLLDKDAALHLPAELHRKIEDALEWTPHDPNGQELFWQRLQDLLHSDIHPQDV